MTKPLAWIDKGLGTHYAAPYRIFRTSAGIYDLWSWGPKTQFIVKRGCATATRAKECAEEHRAKGAA